MPSISQTTFTSSRFRTAGSHAAGDQTEACLLRSTAALNEADHFAALHIGRRAEGGYSKTPFGSAQEATHVVPYVSPLLHVPIVPYHRCNGRDHATSYHSVVKLNNGSDVAEPHADAPSCRCNCRTRPRTAEGGGHVGTARRRNEKFIYDAPIHHSRKTTAPYIQG